MPYRYTIKQLKELTDYEILRMIVRDRQETVTNIYTPLNVRLEKLMSKLDKKQELTK